MMLAVAFGGHRPAVAALSEVIFSDGMRRGAFFEPVHGGRNIIEHPVHKPVGSPGRYQRCVRVMTDHGESLGPLGHLRPAQFRRYILAFAGMAGGNRAAGLKIRTAKLHLRKCKTHRPSSVSKKVGPLARYFPG